MAGTLLLIGAFISMITRITNFTIGGFQGFTADKSLIKQMYSWRQRSGVANNEILATYANDDID